jgi:AcrR family transcriptional regulator
VRQPVNPIEPHCVARKHRIGSLYQYFPSKDAVTIALIERESATLVDEVKTALLIPDFRQALCAMIETAVRHQLQRPKLSRLLDFEESRLSPFMPISSSTVAVHCAIVAKPRPKH